MNIHKGGLSYSNVPRLLQPKLIVFSLHDNDDIMALLVLVNLARIVMPFIWAAFVGVQQVKMAVAIFTDIFPGLISAKNPKYVMWLS